MIHLLGIIAMLMGLVPRAHAATNDNFIENSGGQPYHSPTVTAWTGSPYTYRDSADIQDTMAPRIMFSVWANDITGATLNWNAGSGWNYYTMSFLTDADFKSYWTTGPLVSEVQAQAPGTVVQYDFKLEDGGDQNWLKSDGFFDAPTTGTSWSFTVEGISATPTTVAADSSSTATVSCWVTQNGTPLSGQTVTFSFVSGPGAFTSNNARSVTATTDASGRANVQVWAGDAGTAVVQATNANFTTATTSVSFTSFVIDGDDADFPARFFASGMNSNDSKVAEGTWIWRDALGDARPGSEIDNPGGYNADNWDLYAIRLTGTRDTFRVLASLKDGVGANYPMVILCVDTDVTRDTASTVAGPGPGLATSVKDFGNWWMPAGAATGTRHLGGNSQNERGERHQRDQSSSGSSDGLYPNRWQVGPDNAMDGGADSTVSGKRDPAISANRAADGGGGNPSELKWDYSPVSNEIYFAFQNYRADADHFFWLADETTTTSLNWFAGYWNKAGKIMDFDFFAVRSDGSWYRGTQITGRNWMNGVAWNSNTGYAEVTTDTDDDNRGMAYVVSDTDNPTIEGVIDLDDLFRDTGVRNGDLFLLASAYGAADGNGAWDGVPEDFGGSGDWGGESRFQQIWIERPSSTSDEQTAEWERAITFNNQSPGGGKVGTCIWYAPGGRSIGYSRREFDNSTKSYLSASGDTFEFACPWEDLLSQRRPPFTLRFTIGVGQSASGGGDQFDNFRYFMGRRKDGSGAYGMVSGLLDVVSNQTSSNELNDSDVDYFVDVDFNRDGRVNTTPDTATSLGLTESGDTAVLNSGTIINDATPIFQWTWNDTDGVNSIQHPAWQVQVFSDAAHSALVQEKFTENDSSTQWEYSGAALSSGNNYYWRVRTRDDFGWGPWSFTNAMYTGGRTDSFSFRINSVPNSPSYLRVDGETNPTTLNSGNPTFSWRFSDPDANDGQKGFAIEVYNGAAIVHRETNTTSNTFWTYPDTAPALEGGSSYNWRVRYWDLNTGYSAWAPTNVPSDSTFGTEYTSPGVRDLKIVQVGQSHGTYGDYVMLWNPLDTVVKLAGMSVQRWSADPTTSWAYIRFTQRDTIGAGSYYLISTNAGALTDTQRTLTVITTAQAFALVRNYSQVASITDSDIVDGIGFAQSVDSTSLGNATIDGAGEAVIRKATSSNNTQYGMTRDSDLRFAGHYLDGNEAADWATGTTQDPRGLRSATSRLNFRVAPRTVDQRTVEVGTPFTAVVTAIDAYGQRVSDTTISSYAGTAKFRVSGAFAVSPSLSTATCSGGILLESVTITAATGSCTLYADTTMAMDTTGIGVINGETLLNVVAAAAPTKPVILSPPAYSYEASPCTVTWTASYDTTYPVRYRVQVAKNDSTFGAGSIVADTMAYDTFLAIGSLSAPDSFYVRVVAYDPGNNYDTSSTREFRVVYQVADWLLYETDPALLAPSRTVRHGVGFNLRIIAKDTNGNTVTTFQNTVSLSLDTGTITPASVTFSQAQAGDSTCSVVITGVYGPAVIRVDSGGTLRETIQVFVLGDNRLVISEVLPTDTETSANRDRDEWVEVHNRSYGDVSTNGWTLTDVEDTFALPTVTIPTGGYLVVHWRETGVAETVFGDSDNAAHVYVNFTSAVNTRLGATDEMTLYSSTSTYDSTTVASHVAWANGATWGAQQDAQAVAAGIWTDGHAVDHGGTTAALAGRSIWRAVNGQDSNCGRADWNAAGLSDTYTFTEGFDNGIFDTDLTGVTVSFLSSSGSSETVGIGESLVVRVTAAGGGNPAVAGVTGVFLYSRADTQGIVLMLRESIPGSRLYEGIVTIASYLDSGASLDGMRQLSTFALDTVTAYWVRGGAAAITAVAGTLHHFDITGPGSASNGYGVSLVVAAKTINGATKVDFTGTVNVTVSSGSISPTSLVFAATDSGVDSVAFTLTGASGYCTVTFTNAAGTETGIKVLSIIEPNVVINEIMAEPGMIDWDGSGAVSASLDEWVELFNRAESWVSLSGWRLGMNTATSGGVQLSDSISPRGYLMVYRRTAGPPWGLGHFYDSGGVFRKTVSFDGNSIGPSGLTQAGRLVLQTATPDTVDDVTYPTLNDDSVYMRSWDGAGTFRTNKKATADSPVQVNQRESVPNMRFRVVVAETATLGSNVLLKVTALTPSTDGGDTVTAFTATGVPIFSTGGPVLSTSTLTFDNGVCSTYVSFSSPSGTATLTVRYETNTYGRDTITVLDDVGPPNVLTVQITGVSDSNFYAGVGLIETGAANPADTVWTNSIDTVYVFCTVTVSGGVGSVVASRIFGNPVQVDNDSPYNFSFIVQPHLAAILWRETTWQLAAYDTAQAQVDTVYIKVIEDREGPTFSSVTLRPDTITDGAADQDDDRQIFLTWSVADNDSGAGVAVINAQTNTTDFAINDSSFASGWDSAIGAVGYNVYKVSARDHVGNWASTPGADTIQVIMRTLDDFNTVQARNLWSGETLTFAAGATIGIENRTDAPLYPRDPAGNFLRMTGTLTTGQYGGYISKPGAGGADLGESRGFWRALSFGIRSGDGTAGDLVRVEFPTTAGNEKEDLWRWLPSGGATPSWQEVVIPLNAWTTSNLVFGDSNVAFLYDDPATYGGPPNPVVDLDYIRFEQYIETAVLELFNDTNVTVNAWGITVNAYSQLTNPTFQRETGIPYSGWGALRMNYDFNNTTNNWQGLIFDYRPMDLTRLSALEFMVRLDTGTSARPDSWGNLEVKVRHAGGAEFAAYLNNYIPNIGGEWRKVRIPVNDYITSGFDPTRFDRFLFAVVSATVDPVRGRLLVDDVQWVRGDTTDPAAAPTIQAPLYGQETITQPALKWAGTTDNSGEVYYYLELATDTTFKNLIWRTDTTVTTTVVPFEPSQAEVWWRVTAHDTFGNWTAFSESSYWRSSPAPARPSGLSALGVLTALPAVDTGVQLSWTANTETDVVGYRVYRNTVNDSRAAGMTLLFGGTITGIARLDSSVPPTDTYYYFVVAIDSYGLRSDTAGGVTAPVFTIAKLIDSTSLGLLPGSSIQYRLTIQNAGWGPADSIVVFDTVPANKVFRDTANLVEGWEFQFSTVAAPDQAFYSADYVTGVPPDPTLVRFVRWRKLRVTAGEPAAAIRFRTIIE